MKTKRNLNILEAIRQRRSVRQYTEKIPADEKLNRIIEAATWAPSGLNNQPWKFKVIREKGVKDGLRKFTKYRDIIDSAPLVICVFMDTGATYNREKDIMSVGASIQNMLLEAYELGLGTCWLGEILNRREEVEKYLGVEDDYELMACVTVGYSDEEVTKGCRRMPDSFLLK
ncbi:MAG: nitroreductase family protein [Candidatus Omnitrophica bacterium]|nr:nitroreductase family protein [Candidatus Omnitrophota bacterium]